MIPGTVSMLRIRREKTRAFDRHSENKAYIFGNRMGDMGLCYDIKPVRKEEGKSYWKIPLCDDDATREK